MQAIQSKEDQPTIVVVGNGMVSHRFCQQLTEHAHGPGQFRIVVIGDEQRPAYDRVNLTRLLFGECPEALTLAGPAWYESRGIQLITGDRVTDLNLRARSVRTALGRVVAYDQLVLATGSRPRILPLRGVEHPGVFEYRSADDLIAIRAAALEGRSAVVLGGGVLGLEAARSLTDLGLVTTVVEAGDRLLAKQLDPQSAEVLRDRFEAMGVQVRVGVMAQAIELEGQLRVVLHDGSIVMTDLVVLSVGVTPRDDLAREAGLACLRRGGIVVDDTLQTSAPGVFAIGECAAYDGQPWGFVAPGYAMADVLAQRLRGRVEVRYRPGLPVCDLKVTGLEVSTVGSMAANAESYTHRDETGIRALAVQDGRLVGASVVGAWAGLAQAREAITGRQKITSRALHRFRVHGELPLHLRLPVASWPAERLVCNCMRVSRGQLTAAMTQGATCSAALMHVTGAGALCGSCESLLDELCGGEGASVHRGRWVIVSSVFAIASTTLVVLAPPVAFATSVRASWHEIEGLWRSGVLKQSTGFALLALALVATSITLRKRWARLAWGRFTVHRAFHTTVGSLAILLTIAHTGFRMGHNLNFALMTLFLCLCVLGGATGIVAYLESGRGQGATVARWWRPWIARAHWVATWPLAVLLGFHILAAYYF